MVTGQLTISTAEGTTALLVEDLFVAVPYRKKKIATSLLQELGSWAFKNGASRMQLLADKNNESALEFYHKDGWQSTQLVCLRKYHKEVRVYEYCTDRQLAGLFQGWRTVS